MDEKKIIEAGRISSEVKKFARSFIKKGVPLLEIAEKIENKIIELGGEPAFPTNLSINEIAAHYTPSYDDNSKAFGLLKVDLGVHIDGWIADTAFSVDLEGDDENKRLIFASEQALENVFKSLNFESSPKEIGKIIQETVEKLGFFSVVNLTGHSIEQFELHSGITIPNVNAGSSKKLEEGLFAVEPFVTTGQGRVYEGSPSGIYSIISFKNPRSPLAREVLEFIGEKYSTIPFCSRWVVKEIGVKALIALKELERSGIIHQYPQLIEKSLKKVAQSENTFLVKKDSVKITTK
jgi:methionyl aminopeptidase